MGLPVTKLFCVSTAVRSVASPRSPIIGGAKSCQADPFTSLPSLSSARKCQLQQSSTAALYTLGHIMSVHQKARGVYRGGIERCPVPDDKVPWDTEFPEYSPVNHTAESVLKKPVWADKEDCSDIQFNIIDGKVNRCSHDTSVIQKVNGFPLNPHGRTGMVGRGCLGRWGPNHAADPIVTRWKRKSNGEIAHDETTGKPILQFVSVQRRDNGEWALPGGMVDPGEPLTVTLIREFGEEACNTLEVAPEKKIEIMQKLAQLFSKGTAIYKGYVDDPRNTDNAWMETQAMNFHDEDGTSVGAFDLHAGDDAAEVQWMDISSDCKLYASHIDFIHKCVQLHNAHW